MLSCHTVAAGGVTGDGAELRVTSQIVHRDVDQASLNAGWRYLVEGSEGLCFRASVCVCVCVCVCGAQLRDPSKIGLLLFPPASTAPFVVLTLLISLYCMII
jgi:hypothetical protein